MKFSFFAALLAVSTPVWAQTAPSSDVDYEALKTNAGALRCDTNYELTQQGRSALGKNLEICGTVTGIFGRGDDFSILLTLADGHTQRVDATGAFRHSPALRTGNFARLLCRVEGTTADEIMVSLVAATAAPDAQFQSADAAKAAPRVPIRGGSPTMRALESTQNFNSDGVVIGPEVDLPAPPRPIAIARSRGVLGSRALPAPRSQTPSRGFSARNFGDESSFYAALARQNNPRLSPQNAQFIGVSIVEAANRHGIDARFLAAIVQVESRFNPSAVSSAGARGLGQLMPFNWAPLGVQNPFDARQNLHGAAKLLRINLNTYARDPNSTMLAVAAYHAGVGAVNRAGKTIPKASTHKYVWKVYYAYKALAPELFN